jgi:hypothetical protein
LGACAVRSRRVSGVASVVDATPTPHRAGEGNLLRRSARGARRVDCAEDAAEPPVPDSWDRRGAGRPEFEREGGPEPVSTDGCA